MGELFGEVAKESVPVADPPQIQRVETLESAL